MSTFLATFALLALIGITGTTQLSVENRFIDYYRKSTEIYQGMELIDRELGGTTPLEVIVDAPVTEATVGEENYEEEFEDIYADETAAEAGPALNRTLAERADQRRASTSGFARCAGRSPRSHASIPSTIMADWCMITSRLAPPR